MMGYYSDVDSEDESSDFDVSSEASESSSNSEGIGLKITFKGDFLAEAVEAEKPLTMPALEPANGGSWSWNSADVIDELKVKRDFFSFRNAVFLNYLF